MTKFYCIVSDAEMPLKDTILQLQAASQVRDVEFEVLSAAQIEMHELPVLEEGALLYRAGISSKSVLLEKLLLRDDLKTFYTKPYAVYARNTIDSIVEMEKHDISVPTTALYPSEDKSVLAKQAEVVGGFPLVFKLGGFMHGEGVEKYDDIEALHTRVLDVGGDNSMLKQFIDYESHMRVIVVGDTVVDSVEYERPDDDFRTNAREDIPVTVKTCSDENNQLAIDSVLCQGVAFGGVDVLIDSDGKGYVAEINTPCYFARASNASGVDTAGAMIDHLLKA